MFETFLILRTIQRDTFINVHRSSCNISVILPDFNKFEFPQHIVENTQMKTRPVEVDIRDEANTRFWQFCDRALENGFEFGNRYQ